MKEYLQRFKNPGTIISIASIVGLLLAQFGVNVDQVWLDNTIKLVCSLCLVLGVMNNPTTGGVDLPVIGKTKAQKITESKSQESSQNDI